jgi:hypothetical protein
MISIRLLNLSITVLTVLHLRRTAVQHKVVARIEWRLVFFSGPRVVYSAQIEFLNLFN